MHPLFSYFCKDAEGFLLSVGTQAVIAGRKEGQVDPTVGGSSKLNRRTERITNLTGEFRLTLLLQVGSRKALLASSTVSFATREELVQMLSRLDQLLSQGQSKK